MVDEEKFEVDKAIIEWLKLNSVNHTLINLSDSEKTKLINQNIQKLRKIELTDEEIFEVLKVRFTDGTLEETYPPKDNYKYSAMTEILYLFIGGIFYFLLQYFFLSIIDGLFVVLEYFNKGNIVANFKIIQTVWILILFVIIFSMFILFKKSDSVFEYIKNIKINLFKVLILVFSFYGLIVIQQYFQFEVFPLARKYQEFREIFTKYFDYRRYFIQWFPLVFGLSYLILFYSYNSKNYFL